MTVIPDPADPEVFAIRRTRHDDRRPLRRRPRPARRGRPVTRRVLVIGDSTTKHMRGELEAALRAHGIEPTIDAVSGRTVHQARWTVTAHEVARFDLVVALVGANGLRENMVRDFAALQRLGVDLVATVQAPGRVTINRAIRRVYGGRRIRWAGYADRHYIHPYDGKHYRRAQYARRAQFVADRIAEAVG